MNNFVRIVDFIDGELLKRANIMPMEIDPVAWGAGGPDVQAEHIIKTWDVPAYAKYNKARWHKLPENTKLKYLSKNPSFAAALQEAGMEVPKRAADDDSTLLDAWDRYSSDDNYVENVWKQFNEMDEDAAKEWIKAHPLTYDKMERWATQKGNADQIHNNTGLVKGQEGFDAAYKNLPHVKAQTAVWNKFFGGYKPRTKTPAHGALAPTSTSPPTTTTALNNTVTKKASIASLMKAASSDEDSRMSRIWRKVTGTPGAHERLQDSWNSLPEATRKRYTEEYPTFARDVSAPLGDAKQLLAHLKSYYPGNKDDLAYIQAMAKHRPEIAGGINEWLAGHPKRQFERALTDATYDFASPWEHDEVKGRLRDTVNSIAQGQNAFDTIFTGKNPLSSSAENPLSRYANVVAYASPSAGGGITPAEVVQRRLTPQQIVERGFTPVYDNPLRNKNFPAEFFRQPAAKRLDLARFAPKPIQPSPMDKGVLAIEPDQQ